MEMCSKISMWKKTLILSPLRRSYLSRLTSILSFSVFWGSAFAFYSMADEVIHSMSNMKLTTEEEEVIAVFDKGWKEEIESCTQSLVGKFLTCKPFNKKVAQYTLKKAWGLEEGEYRLLRWVPIYFSSSSRQNLTWKEFFEEVRGLLTIKNWCSGIGRRVWR